jgi:hypothetical protein
MTDALTQIVEVAAATRAQLTFHASYAATAERHPDPDWSAHIVWAAAGEGEGALLAASFFSGGATLEEAVTRLLDELHAAYPTHEPTQVTP